MSIGRMAIALAVLTAVLGSVHGYLWARLVRDAGWDGPWGRYLGTALVVLALSIPLTFVGMRAFPRSLGAPLAWVAYVWMGVLLYLFLLTLTSDLVKGMASIAGALPSDPDRRQWLARVIGAAVGGAAAAIGIGGAANVARGFQVSRVKVPLSRLPASASGYRIVQMSDVHVGPTIGRELIDVIVREANALDPHMVVITGDLVD
ncbi:MAG: metallophosphoesterase, partial [Polyangiaceae bacterium]